MTAPRFSIVIPTRERPHTLEHTLATCLAQEGDFEVVVSDNWSEPKTRELVERRGDPRVRYVRTAAPLAMTDSLEFAVSHARGEYVVIQGDDDGLLRHALVTIDQILRETRTPLLRWECAVYNWPDVRNAHFRPDTLLLPLSQQWFYHALRTHRSPDAIRAVANGDALYSELPVIYSAAIHRGLLDQLRARTGRVFKTRTPDVYAAFALAALVPEYHSLAAPLGLCGRSGSSTGIARHYCKKGSPIDNEFRRMNSAAGLELHPWVPDLPPVTSAVADAFLWAKQELFPADDAVTLDRQRLVRNCLREMEIDSAEEWAEVRASCRAALEDSAELVSWFEGAYGTVSHAELPRPDRAQEWKRYGGTYLYLDAAEFGVRTIDDAAALCERLLGYRRDGLKFQLEMPNPTGTLPAAGSAQATIHQLNEANRVLNETWLKTVQDQDAHLRRQVRAMEEQHQHILSLTAQVERLNRRGGVLRRIANRLLPRRAAG